MPAVAVVGNVTFDTVDGGTARPGGAPVYASRTARMLGIPVLIATACRASDRPALVEPLGELGSSVYWREGDRTARFAHRYGSSAERATEVREVGPEWEPRHVAQLPVTFRRARWMHVAPLLRSDFPAATLAAIAAGRHVLLDGQGLVRAAKVGPLVLDADYDPEVLRHVTALKLADEEAEALGDPGALPVPEVLVTHGLRGATVFVEGRVEHVSAEPIDADPTGTGDAFCVSYAAARAAGIEPVAAAQQAANLVSALLRER